ncbi:MAG: CaiB/BaiF CoA-transferase family protein [Oceanicoccus sp.]
MAYPLEGLKILDFSRVLAGPFAGRMLCDLGADVVKVEPPDGDVTRYWGKEIANIPGYYHQQNAGKRNICIDMRAEGAADLIKQLVADVDIVIENYRPGVMSKHGVGYDELKTINPKLVMLSISGFGQEGPESRRPAFAPVIHSEAGLIHRSAKRTQQPHHDLPLSVADTNASLHGLVGILSAIIMRDRTGLGQHIDIAMIDSTIATDDQIHYDLEKSWNTGPLGDEIFETPFGAVLLSTDFRLFFRLLVSQMGLQDPSSAEMTLAEKIGARRSAVAAYIQTLDSPENFGAVMKTLNIPWAEIRNAEFIQEQVTVKARNSIVQVDDRDGGTRPITQSPYRFSNADSGVRGPASHRGEHNSEVLAEWLNKPQADVESLLENGVLLFEEGWRPKGA